MRQHHVKDYLASHSGKYLLVNSLSRRVHDLQNGYKPLVPRPSSDLLDVAMAEFAQEKVEVFTKDDDIDEVKDR